MHSKSNNSAGAAVAIAIGLLITPLSAAATEPDPQRESVVVYVEQGEPEQVDPGDGDGGGGDGDPGDGGGGDGDGGPCFSSITLGLGVDERELSLGLLETSPGNPESTVQERLDFFGVSHDELIEADNGNASWVYGEEDVPAGAEVGDTGAIWFGVTWKQTNSYLGWLLAPSNLEMNVNSPSLLEFPNRTYGAGEPFIVSYRASTCLGDPDQVELSTERTVLSLADSDRSLEVDWEHFGPEPNFPAGNAYVTVIGGNQGDRRFAREAGVADSIFAGTGGQATVRVGATIFGQEAPGPVTFGLNFWISPVG